MPSVRMPKWQRCRCENHLIHYIMTFPERGLRTAVYNLVAYRKSTDKAKYSLTRRHFGGNGTEIARCNSKEEATCIVISHLQKDVNETINYHKQAIRILEKRLDILNDLRG